MQIILQATHGIVSGEPAFFKRAFGDTFEEYERILLLPHDFIFNREWYERFDQEERLEEYQAEIARLDAAERAELVDLLSSCEPREFSKLGERTGVPAALKRVLPFYIPVPKTELFAIWSRQKALTRGQTELGLADDERVEDAGLDDDDTPAVLEPERKTGRRAAA